MSQRPSRYTATCSSCSYKSWCALIGKLQLIEMSASLVWMNCCQPRRRINFTHLRRLLSLSPSPPHLSLTQEDLWKLPEARFPGKYVVVSTLEDERTHSDAIEKLFQKTVLGFDTEWSPRRPRRLPSLVQLASEDVCVMWQLCYQDQENLFVGEKFPPRLLHLLTSRKITKVSRLLLIMGVCSCTCAIVCLCLLS